MQGIDTLAIQDWAGAMQFLISRAPLSQDDAQLWLELLPLLHRLLRSGKVSAAILLAVASKFAGGSALQWLQDSAAESASWEGAIASQLTQVQYK